MVRRNHVVLLSREGITSLSSDLMLSMLTLLDPCLVLLAFETSVGWVLGWPRRATHVTPMQLARVCEYSGLLEFPMGGQGVGPLTLS